MTQSSDKLRAILDSIQVGVVAIDAAGRVELQNAEASRILGVSAKATRGRKLEDYLSPEHPVLALLARACEQQRELSSHACALPQRSGGEAQIADLTASPMGVGDQIEGAVLTLRDRTIGRELETLVDQRARSELFAHLAAGFAHEVRNPLGGIRGSSELLLGKLDDPALRRYPELIRDETDRILRLLDDLAEFTRGGDLRLQPVNLHQLLDNLIQLHGQDASWKGLEVVREYDPSIPELELDRDRMMQVFLNLVRNAVQAMEGKGRLVLRTRVDAEFHISATTERPARMVRIEVEDSGPGIPEEDLPHIFTPFFTRREQGTGLGLSVSQHWVVRHGGQLRAFNLPDGGARMRVQLPVRRGK
ncbi:MAG: ATP-binding protein [Deltaproteobacteria bacterium]|nr:ATP-binding protein [Deltaproteobacteria bacterium]